jgi:Gas vesicle protein
METSAVKDFPDPMIPEAGLPESKNVSLCEALDRILHKGAVLHGEVMISVADIDLVYLGLQVILASMETARGFKPALGEGKLKTEPVGKKAS